MAFSVMISTSSLSFCLCGCCGVVSWSNNFCAFRVLGLFDCLLTCTFHAFLSCILVIRECVPACLLYFLTFSTYGAWEDFANYLYYGRRLSRQVEAV